MKKKTKSRKESFMSGVMTLMISQIIVKIFGLVYKIYLTNRPGFGDTGNAIYNSGYQIYALLLLLSSIGIPNAISKLVSERTSLGDYKGAHKIFKVAFMLLTVIGTIGSLILFFGADFIANTILQIPEAKLTLMCISPSIVLVAMSSVIRGYFNARSNMKATGDSQALEQILKTVFTVLAVEVVAHLTSNNVTLMAAGANFATTISVIGSFIYIYKFYKVRKKGIHEEIQTTKPEFKDENTKSIISSIFKISIPISLTSIVSSVNKNIDSITVVRGLKKITTEAVAKEQYGILAGKVDTLVALPLSFTVAFATALVPGLSSAKAKNDDAAIEKRVKLSLLITILIGLPCAFGLCVFAKEILQLVFPNAAAGANILQSISFLVVFATLAQTINGALQGLGDFKTPVIALILGVIVKTILNIVIIPIQGIGILGATVSSQICQFIAFFIGFIKLKKMTKIKFDFNKFAIKPVLASAIMSAISYGIYYLLDFILPHKIAIMVGLVSAIIAYVVAVLALKIFSEEEIKDLPKGDKIHKVLVKLKIYKEA